MRDTILWTIIVLILLGIGCLFGLPFGVIICGQTDFCKKIFPQNMGGVRSETTGNWMDRGEQQAIGTSTDLTADFTIESNSTSTIAMRKTKSATTTGACLELDSPGGVTVYFTPKEDGTLTGSTTDICN